MDKATVIDTPDGIAFFQLLSIRGALSLEIQGLKRHGVSAYTAAKQRYGLKGNRVSVLGQLNEKVEKILNEREAAAQQQR